MGDIIDYEGAFEESKGELVFNEPTLENKTVLMRAGDLDVWIGETLERLQDVNKIVEKKNLVIGGLAIKSLDNLRNFIAEALKSLREEDIIKVENSLKSLDKAVLEYQKKLKVMLDTEKENIKNELIEENYEKITPSKISPLTKGEYVKSCLEIFSGMVFNDNFRKNATAKIEKMIAVLNDEELKKDASYSNYLANLVEQYKDEPLATERIKTIAKRVALSKDPANELLGSIKTLDRQIESEKEALRKVEELKAQPKVEPKTETQPMEAQPVETQKPVEPLKIRMRDALSVEVLKWLNEQGFKDHSKKLIGSAFAKATKNYPDENLTRDDVIDIYQEACKKAFTNVSLS